MATRAKERELLPHYDNKLQYYSPSDGPDLFAIMELADAPTHGHMIDIGCGDGRAYEYAAAHGMDYTGVDYSPRRISLARELYGQMHTKERRPGFLCGDLYEALPHIHHGHELAFCCEVLEHLEEPELIWEQMQRLVRQPKGRNGLVVCTCPVNMPYKAHLQVYRTDADIKAAFKPSFIRRYRTVKREHFVFGWS